MKENIFYVLSVLLIIAPHISECGIISLSTHDLEIQVDDIGHFNILINGTLTNDVNLTFTVSTTDHVEIYPQWVYLNASGINDLPTVHVKALHPARLVLKIETVPKDNALVSHCFIRIIVFHSYILQYLSILFGWTYFFAWSISFYPQIYTNFQRKSVIGLNFDFVALNIIGFILYSIFNACLFWMPVMQDEYFNRHPTGLNPVQPNDIFFAFHAVFATTIVITQCIIYERGDQRVSHIAKEILSIYAVILIITGILAGIDEIKWLDFVYYCSYIKLSITFIKYIPQAAMNYRRKSTDGWSIGNIILDFTGGVMSISQMIVNANNYNDWASIYGYPTKFGLGVFTICFDIFFMLQHYIFYRNSQPYEQISEDENEPIVDPVSDNEPAATPLPENSIC